MRKEQAQSRFKPYEPILAYPDVPPSLDNLTLSNGRESSDADFCMISDQD